MRLNPKKYMFSVERGKFLGFMMTHQSIKVNLDMCQELKIMQNPQNLKKVKRLVGRLTSLSSFYLG